MKFFKSIAVVAFITCIVSLNLKTTFVTQGGNTTLSQLLTLANADPEQPTKDGYWDDVVIGYGLDCYDVMFYNYQTKQYEEMEECEVYEITECQCVSGGEECVR